MRTRPNTLPLAAAAATLASMLALTGCAASAPSGSPSPTAATPSPTPSLTAPVGSISPSAEPESEPQTLPSCDTALTAAGYADLASDNLEPRDASVNDWDYPILTTFAADGILCRWAGGGDVHVVFGQLPLDESAWQTTRSDLLAEGFVEDPSTVEGFLGGPDGEDESYPGRGAVYRDGFLYYTSYAGFLEFVPAFAG